LPEIILDLKATNVPVTPTLNIFYQLTKFSQEKEGYLATTSKNYTSDIIALEASSNQVKRWLEASDKMAAHNQKVLDFLQDITKSFHENGISLLVGSDSGVLLSPHGLATHNEMRLLKAAGLSAFDVLATATINPAKALNLDNQIGKILETYKADFIYSSSNPILNLSVLEEPEAVIKNGHWYSRKVLNAMRDEAIESRSFWEEFFILLKAI
jgi:imidazolonepropionase-like amidohydrolase